MVDTGFTGFLTLPLSLIINLSQTSTLTDLDAAIFLDVLEQRYGLMTDSVAQFWEEKEEVTA